MDAQKELDQFADILVVLAQHYHKRVTKKTILKSLPLSPDDTASLFPFLAEKAGFDLKASHYTLSELSSSLLPVILELKEKKVLLLEIDEDNHRFLVQEGEKNQTWVGEEVLKEVFTKKVFLVKMKNASPMKEEYLSSKKHWFWDSLKFSTSLYVDVFIASFLLNIFALLTPLFVRNVYDRVVPNAAFDTLYVLAGGIILVYLFDLLFRFLRTYLLELAGKKSDIIISSKIFEHILNIKLAHKFKSVGAFTSNIKEFDTLRNFLSSATLTMLIDLPFTVIFLFVIYILAGKIMLVPLITGILIIGYGFIISKPLKKHIDLTSKLSSWKNGVLVESLGALETIKSFGLHSVMQWKWEESVVDIAHTNMKSKLLTTSMSTLTNFLVQASNVLVIILGVYAIYDKTLTMGGLIAVTMLTSRALTPLVQISSLIINYEYAKSSYGILDTIYRLPVEKEETRKYISREKIVGVIEFRNVTFTYPDTEYRIFDNVSFKIEPGEKVAILGSNGSGKTTLLKLIMGFYEPDTGTILIDGIDSKQIEPGELREALNFLPQNIVLFGGTIQDNIMYASPRKSTEEMIVSAEKSGLDLFINSNPLGYNFPVEERGEGVSGGQKQLVGLSRCFLADEKKILLLDEPTNALDTQAEIRVLENFHPYFKQKTVLLVSHKRNVLQLVSRVLVLSQGKIVYDGPRDEILKQLEEAK